MHVFSIVCEDNAHYRAATALVDAALGEPAVLTATRQWQGRHASEPWYKYSPGDAKQLPRRLPDGTKVRRHGKLGAEPELRMWRDILYIFAVAADRPALVVMCRDMDAEPDRRNGMDAARAERVWPFVVVVAAADPEVEAWFVSGFEPIDAGERAALASLRKALSFDPTVQSHRLTARPNRAKTDAKAVWRALGGSSAEREASCLANEAGLRARGTKNGVADFLSEIQERVVPVFGAAS